MINSIEDCAVLNNGLEMPWLGFGVFGLEDGQEVEHAVRYALQVGYRSIDTATIYRNERGVGRAIQESSIPRDEIFLTTKLWNDDQREKRVLAAFEESLTRLQVDYVDLYLLHWPVEGLYKESWQEIEKIYQSGRAKAIGVSNFMPAHLDDVLSDCKIVPSVNQVEFHPRLVQPQLLEHCREREIQFQAWSPLMSGQIGAEQTVLKLAEKYQKTAAQIALRWDLQHEVVTIPKSKNPDRIAENADIFDFELAEDDMNLLDSLDDGYRIGPDPYKFDF
jgi:diketogulonate reductase-like aldo/keto reductase